MRLRQLFAVFLGFYLGPLGLCLSGCQPAAPNAASQPVDSRPRASTVPLRIRVVADVSSPEIIRRRWLSNSEQPIALQPQKLDEFLDGTQCDADVVIFPARLIGELVSRDWILKLPEFDHDRHAEQSLDERRAFPPSWQAQCNYGDATYAIPLGCSIPQFIASTALASGLSESELELDPRIDRSAIAELLPATARDADPGNDRNGNQPDPRPEEQSVAPDPASDADVDRQALVDRFLALVFSSTERNRAYGVLLDLETMRPRLTDPEFLQAAELLERMAKQPGGFAAVTGSHTAAWQWATTHAEPVLAIASVTQLDDVAARIPEGQELRIQEHRYINVGGGLIAALAADCRQTQQSGEFLKWLSDPQTRAVLAPLVVGVDSPEPTELDATAWRLRQNLARVALNDQLPQELRIPQAHAMRVALADQLLLFLQGDETAPAALRDASDQWMRLITADRDRFKLEYKRSLGLSTID